mmetsp:Transcript_28134/g.43978  ORF Transcript_28134/g.43978 Transcript_28134/m.43978 type:complete len:101 (-) Transcript_28134:66-368(-)
MRMNNLDILQEVVSTWSIPPATRPVPCRAQSRTSSHQLLLASARHPWKWTELTGKELTRLRSLSYHSQTPRVYLIQPVLGPHRRMTLPLVDKCALVSSTV